MIDLDAIEDRHITASLPKASRTDLVDSVADVTDLLAEVRYLRVMQRRYEHLMETHTVVRGVSLG